MVIYHKNNVERAATCGGVNPPPPECGSSPPLGNCKNGSGSTATLVAGSTDTYEWTCSVGSLSTTCTGTTTTINTTNCTCTANGCSADCDKNTDGDNWVCESPDGGNDSKTCKPSSTTVICGECGDSNETCDVGTPEKHPLDTDDEFLWNCRNIPHTKGQCAVKKILCRAPKPTTPTVTVTTTLPTHTATDVCEPPGSGLQCFSMQGSVPSNKHKCYESWWWN